MKKPTTSKKSTAKKTAKKATKKTKNSTKKQSASKKTAAKKKKTAGKKLASTSKKTAKKKPATKKPASKSKKTAKKTSKKVAAKTKSAKKKPAKKTKSTKKRQESPEQLSILQETSTEILIVEWEEDPENDSKDDIVELAELDSLNGESTELDFLEVDDEDDDEEQEDWSDEGSLLEQEENDKQVPQALQVGDRAPDFQLDSDDGNNYSLDSLAGQRFVLYFYPKDNTSGCTTEACDFRDLHEQFSQKNIVVLGVSPDSLSSHTRFRDNYNLPFPLLSDPDHKIASAYGAYGDKQMYGRTYQGVIRSTFVISPDGRIEAIYSPVKVNGHAEAVLQALS